MPTPVCAGGRELWPPSVCTERVTVKHPFSATPTLANVVPYSSSTPVNPSSTMMEIPSGPYLSRITSASCFAPRGPPISSSNPCEKRIVLDVNKWPARTGQCNRPFGFESFCQKPLGGSHESYELQMSLIKATRLDYPPFPSCLSSPCPKSTHLRPYGRRRVDVSTGSGWKG